jgi:hypothetical protein
MEHVQNVQHSPSFSLASRNTKKISKISRKYVSQLSEYQTVTKQDMISTMPFITLVPQPH